MPFTRDIPTSLNIANTVPRRDSNSEFAVTKIHGDLDGNATTADDGIDNVQGLNGVTLVLSNKTLTASLDTIDIGDPGNAFSIVTGGNGGISTADAIGDSLALNSANSILSIVAASGSSATVTFTINQGNITHNSIGSLTVGDPHTQYAFLAGRSTTQTLFGGDTTAGQSLNIIGGKSTTSYLSLQSNNTGTKSKVYFGDNTSNYFFDELNGRLNLGMVSPVGTLDVNGTARFSGVVTCNDTLNMAGGSIMNASSITDAISTQKILTSYGKSAAGSVVSSGSSATAQKELNFIAGTNVTLTVNDNTSASRVDVTIAASGGSPGGSNTQLQYNNSGAFGGTSGLTWNNSTNTLAIADTSNIVLGTTTGTQIGTGTTQKLGFFGSTPIVQQANSVSIEAVLSNFGFRASGTSAPLSMGTLTIADASNIVVGTTTGTKIGTSTSQMLGFFNATPIVQPASSVSLDLVLSNLGLRAAGTAPLTVGAITATSITDAISTQKVLVSYGKTAAGSAVTSGNSATAQKEINFIAGTNVTLTVNDDTASSRADITIAASGGSTSPGGSNTQLQYNNSSAFGGTSGLTWDSTNLALTLASTTITTSNPILNLSQTWNAGGVTFTAFKVNITNSASAAASLLLDLQLGSTSQFKVDRSGNTTLVDGATLKAGGTTTGLKIGGATTDKLGFFGVTPVVQQLAGTELTTTLTNLGLIASSGSATLTTSGLITANGGVTLGDAQNIVVGTTTGTKIGTSTSQKIGFYNVTPVVQQSGEIRAALVALGLFASGGANGLTTNNGAISAGTSTVTGAQLIGTTGTIVASTPAVSVTQTWNNSGVTFTGLLSNITNSASAAGSLLMDLQVGGSSKFKADLKGRTTAIAYIVAPVSLSDAATISTDASTGSYFTVTIAGNRTLGNPTNPTDGQKVIWRIKQDGTGSRTITLDTQFKLGTDISSVTLSTAANATDFLIAIYDSGTTKWYVTAFVRGY